MEEIRSAPSSWKGDLLDYAQGFSPYKRQFNEKILDTVLAPVSGVAGFRDTFVNQISGIDTSPLDYFLEALNVAPLGFNGKHIKTSIDALVNRKMIGRSPVPQVTQTEPLKSFKDTLNTYYGIHGGENGQPKDLVADVISSYYPGVPLAQLRGEIFKIPQGKVANVSHFYPTEYPLQQVNTPWDKMDDKGNFFVDEDGYAQSATQYLIEPNDLGTGFMKGLADILKREEPDVFGIMANRVSGARTNQHAGSGFGFWPLKKLDPDQKQFKKDLLDKDYEYAINAPNEPVVSLTDAQRRALFEEYGRPSSFMDDIPF
jgi:hypothetical protein